MSQAAQMRKERIERLLLELEYEIIRGVMEREIEPDIHLRKLFPCGGRGNNMAQMELHVWPAGRDAMPGLGPASVKLRLVEDKEPKDER